MLTLVHVIYILSSTSFTPGPTQNIATQSIVRLIGEGIYK